MNPEISLGQVQHLQLTPELRAGIEIMAMNVLELQEHLDNLLMENPLLLIDDEPSGANAGKEEAFDFEQASDLGSSRDGDDDPAYTESDEGLFTTYAAPGATADLGSSTYDEHDVLTTIADEAESLISTIHHQMMMELSDESDITILGHILLGLDEEGYFRTDVDLLADELQVERERIEEILEIMRTCCTPAGIGARSLQERLISQLKARQALDPVAMAIIDEHLEDLAEGRFAVIADALDIAPAQVRNTLRSIRSLDPYPAAEFKGTPRFLIPEVRVAIQDGALILKFDDSLLPSVAVDSAYYEAMREGMSDKDGLKDLNELRTEAVGVVRAVDLRRSAIISISSFVVEHQRAFFEEGIAGLRHLTMAETAAAVGVSESTVSRVANSVAMDTPQGIISLRTFFDHGIKGASDEGISSSAIKGFIKELIENEDKHRPLSDGKIAEILAQRGMDVSRRTVNKYRAMLGILSRTKRKVD